MKKILIIDNFDSFTFNLAEYFKKLGCEVKVYRNTIDPALVEEIKPDALVFSPGPSVPKNAGNMMKIIERYHTKHPMLGICLGHEAFIEYFGGTLKFVEPVHGESSPIAHDNKTIFQNIPQNFSAGRYHSLAAGKVPACFEVSALHKDLVMAIRHKTLPIEGVQFHPESVLTMKGENGLKILKNFLEKYVNEKMAAGGLRKTAESDGAKAASTSIRQFLEQSIAEKLSFQEQEKFLQNKSDISAAELAEGVSFLRTHVINQPRLPEAIDICGTGGSGLSRINTSTISSFILASLGVNVAKHGNKAASGRCGSFDLLELLGVRFDLPTDDIESIYKTEHCAFLFARKFYPVFKHFADVRQKIGKPTFFNLLGPLLNPAYVIKQIIGTAFRDKMELIAETCRLLGKEHVYVVCGEDGLDEVTLTGKTFVVELHKGAIQKYTLTPNDFGVPPARFEEISGGDAMENVAQALEILKGKLKTRHRDLVLINTALALRLAGTVRTLKEGYRTAEAALTAGSAYETFEKIKTISQTPGILLRIVQNKKSEIEKRKRLHPLEKIRKNLSFSTSSTNTRDFKKSLSSKNVSIIAEIKKRSPTGGKLAHSSFSIARQAKLYEAGGVNAISVVCDKKFFGGALEDLRKAKRATQKTPILCKDFIVDLYQIYEAKKYGADAILLIAGVLTEKQLVEFLKIARELRMSVLCEVHTLEELHKVLRTPAEIIGINNRDLNTFHIDSDTAKSLILHIPKDKIIVVESGISTRHDMQNLPQRKDAVLIGTSLMRATDPTEKINELLGKKIPNPLLKVCGVRNVNDARLCEKMGIQFIGLNFVPTSKRRITLKKARTICRGVKNIKKVGIFQNQTLEEVNRIARTLPLDFIQLSGDEDVRFVKKCIKPVIKTICIKSPKDLVRAKLFEGVAQYILFDGAKPGSGKGFGHSLLKRFKKPFFLAGGINPANIKTILQRSRPFGIDVASGVETNGVFDPKKVKLLYNSIRIC